MKKTISIHLAGFLFNIEEDAHSILATYLEKTSAQFSNEEREEIMHDIESRIAELFREKLEDRKEVLFVSDVEDMISVMGSPEDYNFETEEETSQSREKAESSSTKQDFSNSKNKRIYRDEDNAILGGVCSGLAVYFGVDPVVFRVIFITFTLMGGSGILIYLVLYFAIPEAKTIADKLKMKGSKIDVSSIKNQFEKVKEEINDKENQRKLKRNFNKFIASLEVGFRKIAKGLSKIIGAFFFIGGLLSIIIIVFIFNKDFLNLVTDQTISVSELLSLLFDSAPHNLIAYYSLISIILIPVVYTLIRGVHLLVGAKNKLTYLKIILLSFWIISVVGLAIAGSYLVHNFDKSAEDISTVVNLENDNSVLYIDSDMRIFSGLQREGDEIIFDNFDDFIQITDSSTLLAYPRLVVETTDKDFFEIKTVKKSRGEDKKEALRLATSIDYPIEINEGRIFLPNYFSISSNDKFRAQQVIVYLRIPNHKSIRFGGNIRDFNCSIGNGENLKNTIWINKNGELELVK